MISDSFYAVIVSPDPDDVPDDQEVTFFGRLDWAVQHRDDLGGGARVYTCKPLSESALWDWAIDTGAGHGPMVYVNERAARACVGTGGTVLRRRAGTSQWEPAPTVTP